MPWGSVALTVFLLVLPWRIQAQEDARDGMTVAGLVVDAQSGAPLDGAAVTVEGTALQAFTGADGRFSFRAVPPGEHVWVIDRLGYATWQQPFTAVPFDQLRIGMMPKPVALENITVTVDRLEARRKQATVPVHSVSRDDLRSSVAVLAAGLVESRSPWGVTSCPVYLGATVYPLDQDHPPNESSLADPGQRVYDPTQLCVWYRGRVIKPSVCLDDRPITLVELLAYGAAEIHAIDFLGGQRPQIRLYTERFLEEGKTVRPFTVPCI